LLLLEEEEKMSLIALVILTIISLQILVCNAYSMDMLNFKAMNTRLNEENENKVMKVIFHYIKTVNNKSSKKDVDMVYWLIGMLLMRVNKRLDDKKHENTVYWYSRQG
jgi:hypothetical protein